MLVIDANIVLFWTIDTPVSFLAKKILRSGRLLIAPDVIVAEVTNALVMQVRRKLLDKDRAADGLNQLPRWFLELCPSSQLRNRAFALSLELNHPAHDCFYLALALLRDTRLVTSDAQFHSMAVKGGYEKAVSLLDEWAED